jgi:glycosyltransferase involved in cell wall biosynthesis
MNEKISVIIPVYNAQKYLAECLSSVERQTHVNWEIICVNDGSTDDSADILKEYKTRLKEKLIMINTPNQGASKARNKGLSVSSGTFIQFLDADDVIHEAKLEKQLAALGTEYDVVISDRAEMDENMEKTIEEYSFPEILRLPLETSICRVITTCNPLYRKELVMKLGGYNEELNSCQDWDFHIRMILSGAKITYLPGVFFLNRRVPGSLSSNWVKVFLQSTIIIQKLKPVLLEHPEMNARIRGHIAGIYLNSAIYCEDRSRVPSLVSELKFWSKGGTLVLSPLKKFVAMVTGYGTLVKILRLVRK